MNHHYPHIKKIWDTADYEINSLDENQRFLEEAIDGSLSEHMEKRGIKYSKDDDLVCHQGFYEFNNYGIVHGKRFSYKDFIELDDLGNQFSLCREQYLYLATDPRNLIYRTKGDNAERVLDKLKEICNAVEADDDIKYNRRGLETVEDYIHSTLAKGTIY